ncbi:proline-specific peptidase [Favolaschia claudopus]|uniref:Proline-specific peptidase n=1 Tax=Favolaschia claudopus TaxID=2862362 RepID=A0AAW0BQ69_9AGAR
MIETEFGRAPFTLPFDGTRAETFYTVFGNLKTSQQIPLVVCHGGRATHHYLKSLSQLTEEFSIPVVLYDQLGFGLSSHFPQQEGNASFWTIEVLVEQLRQLINYLGIQNEYDLLGHSFGTALSIELASKPALRAGLRKLVLWSPAASTKLLEESMKQRREMLPADIREILVKHETEGTADSDEYRKAMLASMHENFCRLEVWPDELMESFSYSGKDSDASLTLFGTDPLAITGSTKDWSSLQTAHFITVPTMILNGQYDWSDEALQPLLSSIPVVEWVKFADSSHLLHFEEKERFMETLSKWLARSR